MNNFKKVVANINLAEYAEAEIDAKQQGGDWKASCLTQKDEDPSLSIFYSDETGKWKWKCFSCQDTGDIIDLHQKTTGMDKITAMKDLAKKYNIEIDLEEDDSLTYGYTVFEARKIIQEILHENLLGDQQSMNKLLERGINKKDIVNFGIGIEDGNTYKRAKKKLSRHMKNIQNVMTLLIETGIAHDWGTSVRRFIKAGRLTIPVYSRNQIAWWHIHKLGNDDGGKRYQIFKKKRMEGIYLWNQEVAERSKEFYLTEGVFDAIQLIKAGKPAVALLGVSNEKIKFLQQLKVLHPDFEELSEQKDIHIMFDRDKSGGGQRMATKISHKLAGYHNVFLYYLPMGKDIDDYLREGGEIADLKRKKINPETTDVTVSNKRYWVPGEEDEEGNYTPKPISDFTIERKYVYIDEADRLQYDVFIESTSGGERTGPIRFVAENWSTERSFTEWLGTYGDFNFMGNTKELRKLQRYIQAHSAPIKICDRDAYGYTNGVWLFENGIIEDGKIYEAEPSGITLHSIKGYEGIYSRLRDTNEVIKYHVPDDYWDTEKILEELLTYYDPEYVLPAIGIACAIFNHDVIRSEYQKFPAICCYGQTRRGKTSFARMISALLGSSHIKLSGESTPKAFARTRSSCHNLPVLINEFDERRFEHVVRSTYDGDPYVMAKRTIDDQTTGRGSNAVMLMTTEHTPRKKSIINRLIPFDFWEFYQYTDEETSRAHHEFEADGVGRNKNIGFMVELSGTNTREKIISDIDYTREYYYPLKGSTDIRCFDNICIMFGAIRNAFAQLNIKTKLDKIRKKHEGKDNVISKRIVKNARPPTKDDLKRIFRKFINRYRVIQDFSTPIKSFFEVFARCMLDSRSSIEKYVKWDANDKGERLLRFNMTHVFSAVKEKDNRAERKLESVTSAEITAAIKDMFGNQNSKVVRKDKQTFSSYSININKLQEKLGVKIHERTEEYQVVEKTQEEFEADEDFLPI